MEFAPKNPGLSGFPLCGRFTGKFILNDTSDGEKTVNWRTDESIYNFIVSRLDSSGRLKESGMELPDEKKTEDGLRYAPGMTDAVFGNTETAFPEQELDEFSDLIFRSALGDEESENLLYERVCSVNSIVSIIDRVLNRLEEDSFSLKGNLADSAADFAFRSAHRNAVKFGIALLGFCRSTEDLDAVKILGLHDEFTLFAAVAVMNMSSDSEKDLLEIAKKAEGWGRIQSVQRLAEVMHSSEAEEWLVHEGYKNSIMYEYLTYIAAVHGKLYQRLCAPEIERRLFDSAGEIIEGLISGGPAEDMSDYDQAFPAVEQYIRHSVTLAEELQDFIVLNSIKDFLEEIRDDIQNHEKNGWNQDNIADCLIDINSVMRRPEWRTKTERALNSRDLSVFTRGKWAASILGIEYWDKVWELLQENPGSVSLWSDAVNVMPAERSDDLILLAVKSLPLEKIASGPADAVGFGEEYKYFICIEYLITYLGNFPGKGGELILAGLQAPVTRTRNMCVQTLGSWGKENWSTEIEKAVRELSEIEPNPRTKSNLERVLLGEKLVW